MGHFRPHLTICVIVLCAVSNGAYSSIYNNFAVTGVSFVGKLALSELLFNIAPAEASSYPFFHRMGHYVKSSEESDEDDEENASHGRIEIPKPQITPQNGDQCLAKLLCGMSVAASNKATKPDYYKDYANLVSRYFQVFGSEDGGSIESIEAYDDYSVEDDEPAPSPPPKPKAPEKFDISLGFTSFLSSVTNHSQSEESDPTMSPKVMRNRGAGKLSQRLARAERILADLNRQGRKPQPSHCQRLTGCSYSFKELRAKLKSGTKGKISTSSSSSGKAPLRYKVQSSQAKPTSNVASNEQQFLAFKDPNKGDDELDEIFGADAFAPAKPKKKTQTQALPEPPPPPPIYIRRTIIKKKRPSSSSTGPNDDEEHASTTIIRVAPVPVQPQQNKPAQLNIQDDDSEEKPKRKVNYKKPPKKTKVKDNGDDEDDDINKTAPVKFITSEEYNAAADTIYNSDIGYQKEVPKELVKDPPAFPKPSNKDEDSDEEEDEEDEGSEEDEENDDDDGEDKSKKRKVPIIKEVKPNKIVYEDDDEDPKKKLSEDDEVAEAQKDFWGGLTFVNRKKEKEETIKKPKTKGPYKLSKGQSSSSREEESKEDENSKESEENDDSDDEKKESAKKQPGPKIHRGKLDIDIPPSAEHDLAFPSRRSQTKKEKVSLKPNKEKSKNNKKKDDSSSEEENASFVITEIGGRPLAPPKDPSLKKTPSVGVGQPTPFKLQFISPYQSKQQAASSYSASYSAPPVFGGSIKKPEKPRPAAAPLTSHAFLKSNLPENAEHTNVQGKPDMFSRITNLSPITSFTSFFRKGPKNQQESMPENNAPPVSPFMKRPVGPESSKYRRSPNRDKKKKKF